MKKDKSKIAVRLEKWCIRNLYEILFEKQKTIQRTEKEKTELEAINYILEAIAEAIKKKELKKNDNCSRF